MRGNDSIGYGVCIVPLHRVIKFRVPERQTFAVFGDDPLDVPDCLVCGIRRMFLAGRVGVKGNDVCVLIAAEFAEPLQKISHLPAEVAGDVRGDDADRRVNFPALFKCDLCKFDIILRRGRQVGFIQDFPVPDTAFEMGNRRADIVPPVVKIRHDRRFAVYLKGGAQRAAPLCPFRQITFQQNVAENTEQNIAVPEPLIHKTVGEAEIEFPLFRLHGRPLENPVYTVADPVDPVALIAVDPVIIRFIRLQQLKERFSAVDVRIAEMESLFDSEYKIAVRVKRFRRVFAGERIEKRQHPFLFAVERKNRFR